MSHTLQFDRPQPFTQHFEVEAHDIDGLGHTNNLVYVRWCQATAWSHSQQLGIGLKDYQQLQRAMAIRHASYDYLQASYLGEPVCVATWIVASDGRLNLTRQFQVFNTTTGVVLCRAELQFVCINLENGKPSRMPSLFKSGYGQAVCAQ